MVLFQKLKGAKSLLTRLVEAQLQSQAGACTSELWVPFAAVANCPAARSCSSIAAVGVLALEALRAWDCA